jgi:hypothetical protein
MLQVLRLRRELMASLFYQRFWVRRIKKNMNTFTGSFMSRAAGKLYAKATGNW